MSTKVTSPPIKFLPLSGRAVIVAVALLAWSSSEVFAQCSDPDGPEGSQVFNSTHDVMQYCDGADWISMDGSVTAPAVPDDLGNHTASFSLDMGGFKVINLGTASDPADGVTKAFVDSVTGTSETDPKVGTITNTKWCQGDATGKIQCTFDAPAAAATTGQCVARDQKTSGTNGGIAVGSTWTKRSFSDVTCYGITGVSISSGSINIPAGQYYVDVISTYLGIAPRAGTRLVVNGQAQDLPFSHAGPSNAHGYVRMSGLMNVKTAGTVDLQYYNALGTTGNDGLGMNAGISSTPEVYSTMYIKQISTTPVMGSCVLDGQTVLHGASYSFYSVEKDANCAGQSQLRTCIDGGLDGSPIYQYATCTL